MQTNDNTRTTAQNENALTRSSKEQQMLAILKQLNEPTRQLLLVMMKAVAEDNVSLVRTCQRTLPKSQRHLVDDLIDKMQVRQEIPTYLMVLTEDEKSELNEFVRSGVSA